MKVFIMTGWYVFIMTMSMAFNSCEVGKRDGNGGSSSTESAIVAGQPIALEGSFDGIDISGVDELTIAHGDSAQVTFHGSKEADARPQKLRPAPRSTDANRHNANHRARPEQRVEPLR